MCNQAAGLSSCLTKVQDSGYTVEVIPGGYKQGQGSRENASSS